MCLGIPGQVIGVTDDGLRMGLIDFGGIRREVCLAYAPEAQVGDYVIVHVGFAISRVDEAEAARTIAVIRAIPDALRTELGETGETGETRETNRQWPSGGRVPMKGSAPT